MPALFALLLLLDFGSGIGRPQFVSDPILVPSAAVPLAATLVFEASEPTLVHVDVRAGAEGFRRIAETEFRTHHEVPILGVKSGKNYLIRVTLIDSEGNKTTHPTLVPFATPALPSYFPPIQLKVSQPQAMEPGVTLFSISNNRNNPRFLVMVDELGEVVWYYESVGPLSDSRRLPNGNILYVGGRSETFEIDMLGNVVQAWWAGALDPSQTPPGAVFVNTDSFHHEASDLPESMMPDFVALSSEAKHYENYPASEVDQTMTQERAWVVGDVVVEYMRDGTVCNRWSMLDLLDPFRISYGSLGGFWTAHYGLEQSFDWSHGNAVVYDRRDDSYIVSVRAQDAVVKFDRRSGQLKWILGDHFGWGPSFQPYLLTPVGTEFEWNYHQHASKITREGHLLMFDNGNGRAIAPNPQLPDNQRYSRAVIYDIDESAMTVRQLWSYGGLFDPTSQPYYSSFVGDADQMFHTGNILVTDGGTADLVTNIGYGRIAEVTRTVPPQIVFEIDVKDQGSVPPVSYSVYRSDRLPSVYP